MTKCPRITQATIEVLRAQRSAAAPAASAADSVAVVRVSLETV
jgi:hypothetical protein